MAGIYIHIPFCQQACTYCNFYFVTSRKQKGEFLKMLHSEILLNKNWPHRNIDTIYFGGGTPSLLDATEIDGILQSLDNQFNVSQDNEITLEANPDDLNIEFLQNIKAVGINRLSIGIQSFIDRDLELMNRSHSVFQAIEAVNNAREAGFENISIDLIYGIPGLNIQEWESNIRLALDLEIQHLSAYCLTVEKGTVLYHQIRKGKLANVDEEESALQFEVLLDTMSEYGFEHYEISNFSPPSHRSQHNSAYWQNLPYLGLGPSAHSYDLKSRSWNVSNIKKYGESIQKNKLPSESEVLSEKENVNEFILTQIRTSEGLRLHQFSEMFGESNLKELLKKAEKMSDELLAIDPDKIILTRKGKLLADQITVNLMI